MPPVQAGSHILDVIDKMIAAPVSERHRSENAPNLHAGAAAAVPVPASPILGPRGISVERPASAKDDLDQAAELFKVVFKGDIIP